MKKVFIIANWKSHKTVSEATEWFNGIRNYELEIRKKEIIVCPSFTLLSTAKSLIVKHNLPLKLGAQDVSPFDEGAYTGAVNAKQIKEFAEYVLIGHSERKKYFFETEEQLVKKVAITKVNGLTPIYFVQNETIPIPHDVAIAVYEPPSSISPGPADNPENAERVAKAIKQKGRESVLYGGNVTAENVSEFTKMPHIDGVFVGRASLDPASFLQIIQHA